MSEVVMDQMVCANTDEDDEETHRSDLEVASVFSRGMPRSRSASPSKAHCSAPVTPAKYNFSPFRPSTVMTNISRGNFRTTTPAVVPSLTLHEISAQGEIILLRTELKDRDINGKDEHGLTCLMWAAGNNQLETVQFLMDKGADFNLEGNKGETALLIAAAHGHPQVVLHLLHAGMDINKTCQNGTSALCYAAYSNHVDCVRLLLEWGADLTKRNKDGHTALDISIKQAYKEVQMTIEKHMLSLLDPS